MSGYYNRKGKLKRKHSLKTIKREENGKVYLSFYNKNIAYHIYFVFQNASFRFIEALSLLEQTSKEKAEILPGIYIENANHASLLNRLRSLFCKASFFTIINENKRDNFIIKSTLEDKDARNTTASDESLQIYQQSQELIDVQKIEQPNNLGGGKCGGCPIVGWFNRIGLCYQSEGGYSYFTEEEIIKSTENIQYFLKKCKESKCYKTYKTILQQGYIIDPKNMITIEETRGIYTVAEGKHRVCAMKKFGYTKPVPVIVGKTPFSNIPANTHHESFWNMAAFTKSYYDTFNELGISKQKARKLLNTSNASVVDYLDASIYSYNEIYNIHYKHME